MILIRSTRRENDAMEIAKISIDWPSIPSIPFPLGLKLQGAARTASTLMQGYLVSIWSRLLRLCFDFLISFLFYSIYF